MPESAQAAIATGLVTVKAARAIEQIAKVSEQVAEAVIAAAVADLELAAVLVDRPGEAVSYVAREAAEDPGSDLVCVAAASWQPHDVTELPLAAEHAEQIAARVAKLPWWSGAADVRRGRYRRRPGVRVLAGVRG